MDCSIYGLAPSTSSQQAVTSQAWFGWVVGIAVVVAVVIIVGIAIWIWKRRTTTSHRVVLEETSDRRQTINLE